MARYGIAPGTPRRIARRGAPRLIDPAPPASIVYAGHYTCIPSFTPTWAREFKSRAARTEVGTVNRRGRAARAVAATSVVPLPVTRGLGGTVACSTHMRMHHMQLRVIPHQ